MIINDTFAVSETLQSPDIQPATLLSTYIKTCVNEGF